MVTWEESFLPVKYNWFFQKDWACFKLVFSSQFTGLCNRDKEAPHLNSYVDKFEQDDEDIIVFDKVALYVPFLLGRFVTALCNISSILNDVVEETVSGWIKLAQRTHFRRCKNIQRALKVMLLPYAFLADIARTHYEEASRCLRVVCMLMYV